MDELTQEQEFLLARIHVQAMTMERAELIQALVNCWEARLTQKQIYTNVLAEHGIGFRMSESIPCIDESEQEASQESLIEAMEEATMELDMDEIVLSEE